MGPKPKQPTPEEIVTLRKAVLSELETANALNTLDSRDLDRFKNKDEYVSRFLMHNFNDSKKAQTMAVDTLKWRRDMKVNDLTVDSLNQEILNRGLLMVHNRDVDDCKMLIFSVQLHIRGSGNMEDLRKLMIYWIERLEREEKGKWITVVFDMHNTGMKNMDMDMIQYVINLFKFYYPYILNYILVLDMPWILNAMWKIIKSWLPPEAIEKIKFLDKKTITTYVTSDQCLTSWGGTDEYSYTFEPETVKAAAVTAQLESKKVTFAETGSTADSSKTSETASVTKATDGTIMVDPPEELIFSNNRVGASAPFMLQNLGEISIAFKIKTTSPEKFRVKPSVGVLTGSEQRKILVTLIDSVQSSTLVRDKFLVVATPTMLPADAIPENDVFKNPSAELSEVKLRVGIESSEVLQQPINGTNHIQNAVTPIPPAVTDKLNLILSRQGDLEQQIASARRIMFYTLLVMLVLLSFLVITSNNLAERVLVQGNTGTPYPRGSEEL